MVTSLSPSPTLNQAWQQASDEAATLTLPERLWQRPQVEGITIDGPTSQDLDDAIYLEETPTGAIASIHIADVAELIPIGSALDKVAIARTQTRYLRRSNIPMLPHALSEDKLSLQEGQPRPTLTIQVTLNQQGDIESTALFESWLVSAQRFSYEQADRACQRPSHPFHALLQRCQSWADRLNQARQNQGAIGGLYNAAGLWVDEDGLPIVPSGQRYHAQMVIQEFMILANRAVARWLAERDVLALYRNHTARAIAPEREAMMQALLTTGSMTLIRQQLQNWLNKAEYSPTLVGHFALNLTAYCHFTSPIRRLADLLNHRIVKAILHEQPHPYRKAELEQLCDYIATVSHQAEKSTKAFYKQRDQQRYQTQLEGAETTAILAALSNKEFDRLVKHAVKENNLEPIQAAALLRLEEEQLSVQSLYLLLIHSDDDTLRQCILASLQQRPEEATSLLSMAIAQEPTWEQLDYVEADPSSESPPFVYWLEVSVSGEVKTTRAPARSVRKQTARHLACLKWLEAFVTDELVSPVQRQPLKVSEKTASESEAAAPDQAPAPAVHPLLLSSVEDQQNVVGLLQELCQSQGWAMPAYQFAAASTGFVCTCSVQVQAETFTSQETASQKKQAKQLAAKETFVQLQRWFTAGERAIVEEPENVAEPERVATRSVEAQTVKPAISSASVSHPLLQKQLKDGQNFIGFLQQLCQTLAWPLPEYEFAGETPEFVCTCRVWVEGYCFSAQAMSSKKKKAKYFASKEILLELQQRYGTN